MIYQSQSVEETERFAGQLATDLAPGDCIALEGLACRGLDNRKRLFCPRGPLFYWREAWLERATAPTGDAKR